MRVRMMKQVFRLSVLAIAMTAFASHASAQALPWEGRGFANVNFGIQLIAEDVATTNTTFTLYDETGKLSTAQAIDSQAPFFDIGGGFRIAGNFGFGFAYSRLSATGAADVTAQVPSPIYYDRPRTSSATVNDLEHVEDGYHFQALWMLPLTDRVDILLSGGPSWFSLTQGIVTSPQIAEVGPPYTSVNVTVSQSTTSGSQIGFNVGADLTYRFANNVGIGAMVRYTSATVGLTPQGGEPSDVKVGGFQFGGGLRLRF
jgi:opacity protein-like surface antigen